MSKFKFNPDKADDGSPFTNGERADFALHGIIQAERAKELCSTTTAMNLTGDCDIDEDMITDTISDIAHLCDRDGIDFEAIIRRVRNHHQHER